ncbi:hypothetical protein DM02DRAFT_664100 [Periconia macrospinosa]|uniref:Uncharacterized protein n=1 Tax=Periconia macrospinosa TaxID=97972 RepID=A0A2V1CZY1_9PLEO|nr:hypothetical protein DM02DRAFT_664100 [Periconia macrospinosa]
MSSPLPNPLPPPTVARGTAWIHQYTILGVEPPEGADLRQEEITDSQTFYLLQDQQLGTYCVKNGTKMLQDQPNGKAEHYFTNKRHKNIRIKPQSDSLWLNSREKVDDEDIEIVDVILWEHENSHSVAIIFKPISSKLLISLQSFREALIHEAGIYDYEELPRCGQTDFMNLTGGKVVMEKVKELLRQKYPDVMEKKRMRSASREASVLALREKTPPDGEHKLIRELRDNLKSLENLLKEIGKSLEEIKRLLRMVRDSAVVG